MTLASSRPQPLKLRATLVQEKKTATGLRIPDEVVAQLGAGRKPPVKVTINGGYTYRSSIASMGGVYMLGVSAAVREAAGVRAGDELEVELTLDTEPREAVLHPDFEAVLAASPMASAAFHSLSFSNKQRLALPIAEAKTEETRQRRIAKALEELRADRP